MLFDACTIGGIHAACRIVRSATFEGMADAEGHPTDKLCHMYETLAEGGTGIIITGMIAASRLEPHQHHQILLDDDSCIAPPGSHHPGSPRQRRKNHCPDCHHGFGHYGSRRRRPYYRKSKRCP